MHVYKDTMYCRVTFNPVHVMVAYRESRGLRPLIINNGTRWGWFLNFTLLPLNPLKVEGFELTIHTQATEDIYKST
jgi:hypothetical protein